MYPTLLVFTEMTRIPLNNLPHHTRIIRTTLEPHKNVWFVVPKPEKPVLFHLTENSHRFFHTNEKRSLFTYVGFALLRSMIGCQIYRHFLNQSDTK